MITHCLKAKHLWAVGMAKFEHFIEQHERGEFDSKNDFKSEKFLGTEFLFLNFIS